MLKRTPHWNPQVETNSLNVSAVWIVFLELFQNLKLIPDHAKK